MEKYNPIKQNITQVILIVFSVVLGLYLSERIEERKKRQESEILLAKLKSEVLDNLTLLEYWVPYHQEIYENFDSLCTNEEFVAEFIDNKFNVFEKLFTRGRLMTEMPSNDAWDIAKSHPLIVNVDYDKLLALSRIYSQQKNTFEPGKDMFNLFNSKDVNTEKDAKLNLRLMVNHISELVAREMQLMEYYNEAKEPLDLKEDKTVDN